jgi:DNA-binding MarR family transcriptional regulator
MIASPYGRSDHDPALLAFVKCHLTSFPRWDTLCLLSRLGGRWVDAAEAAHELHRPREMVEALLDELSEEGLVEARRSQLESTAYRLDPVEPSTRVIDRLVSAATRSQELRQIIVARVLDASKKAC